MFFRQTRCLLPALAITLALCSCSRERRREGIASVAILPLEDDSSDGLTDGFGSAAPHLLQWQLDGTRDLYVFAATDANAAAEQHARRVLYGWYRRGSEGLEAHVSLRDSGRNRAVKQATYRGDAAAVLNGMARFLSPSARSFHREDDRAIQSLGLALGGKSSEQAQFLQAEMTANPPFVPAVLLFARALLEHGQREEATRLLERAQPAFDSAQPLDRARFAVLKAAASGDAAAGLRALATEAQLAPADASARRSLADLQFNRRDWQAAERSYVALTHMQPWDGSVFNQLAYVRMFLRDKAGALQAIEEYRQATPGQAANALDSRGEINWYFADFRAAEQDFLRASQGDIPLLRGTDVIKAAEARFMQGDSSGADQLFQRYVSWRASAGDPLLALRQAEWLYVTGRGKQAEAALSEFVPRVQADAQSQALAQLSFWKLLAGNRTEASQLAGRAAAAASNPQVRNTAALCAFYALPSAPASEWLARAAKSFQGTGPARDAVVGTALVLDGHFAEAIAPLSNALSVTSPNSDGNVRGLLAQAQQALGHQSEAARLMWPMPMPFYNGDPVFDGAWFPRWLEWRKQSR